MTGVAAAPMLLAAVGAFAAFLVARLYGWLPGLVVPGLAAGAALVAGWWPVGHAEETMGRGLALLFFWLPLVTLTLAGAAIGLISRWKAGRRGKG